MNENKFPGAVTVGYMAVFMSLFYFALLWSGWIEASDQDYITIALIFNFLIILIGLFALSNVDKLDSVLFIILGTFWTGFLLRVLWYPGLSSNSQPAVLDGWALLLAAIVFFILWIASLKGNAYRKFFLLGLWLTFLVCAIGNLSNVLFLMKIFAYLSFITAVLAGIYGASTIIDFKKT